MGQVFKIANKSNPKNLAMLIVSEVNKVGHCVLRAVGAAAVNQAIKGLAIAVSADPSIVCVPSFSNIEVEGEQRTAITLNAFKK